MLLFHTQITTMNTVFKHSQNALNQIQRKVKQKLEEIQFLDKQCLQLDYHLEKLRETYLQENTRQKTNQESQNSHEENIRLQDIAKLQEELRQLAMRKIRIAQDIQNIVAQCSEQIEKQICETAEEFTEKANLKQQIKSQHLFQSGLKKQKGRQKNVDPEIKAIIKEYYDEKESEYTVLESVEKYCICKKNAKILYPGSMIECENPKCKVGWYHFQCVGISFDLIPNHWFCSKCQQQQLKNVKKIKFQHEEKKIELEIKKEIKQQQQPYEATAKRKRGRPRKVQPSK